MKKCTKCEEWLDESCFRKRAYSTKNGIKEHYYGDCSSCQDKKNIANANKRGSEIAEYQSKFYKTVQSKRRKVIRNINVKKVRDLKESTPCKDCGLNFPHYVMDFDHLGNKIDAVSRMLAHTSGWETILKEIAKCEIVCSNCHRARTWIRLKA